MIRLYVDQENLEPGQLVIVSNDEMKYFRSVRRGVGEVCLFNRQGLEARGDMTKEGFRVRDVRRIETPVYDLTLAMALPESSIVATVIKSLSELGVKELIIFKGQRSQGSVQRLNQDRMEKLALEACRQSGRGTPLAIRVLNSGLETLQVSQANRLFFDESPTSGAGAKLSKKDRSLLIIGCEGGWTDQERDIARQNKFNFIHLKTPVMRVETAAIAGALWGLESIFGISAASLHNEEG